MIEASTAAVPLPKNQGRSGTRAPTAKLPNEEAAAAGGDPIEPGLTPSSSRVCTSSASSGSLARAVATSSAAPTGTPRETYSATSSLCSDSGWRRSSSRSMATSRWISSFWALIETYSPAAMENAPATSPARPARRTTPAAGWAPATPRMRETLVSRPSLTPKTAARAAPPWTLR